MIYATSMPRNLRNHIVALTDIRPRGASPCRCGPAQKVDMSLSQSAGECGILKGMKRGTAGGLAAIALVFAASAAGAANLLPDGGFEKWNAAKGQPGGPDWRWSFSQPGTNGFSVCELSESERHGGRTSLHLKDRNGGSFNHNLSYQFSKEELKAMAGKTVRASAWIKQVFASNPPFVGIALTATGEDGKSVERHNGTGTTGATGWVNVHVKVKMPENPKSARLRFDCAQGFGNVGEMYVDDVVVSSDPADHPKPTLRPPSADSLHAFELPDPGDTPEEAAYRKSLREQPPRGEDGRARPEIRNGTWYFGGKPEFYLGVWLYNADKQWGPKCNPLGIDHPAYKEPPSKELFEQMGFNSSQISSAHGSIGAAVRGLPLTHKKHHWQKDWKDEDKDIARFFGRFGDMPMVMDFAFGYNEKYPASAQRLLSQRKAGSSWHSFVPFCPHSPEGWRYYRDYFLGGTRAAMRNGCNVFLYELFNESAWNDMCRYNVVAFAREMKAKYRTIAAANAAWRTDFDNFAEVACQSDLKQFWGVWYDWCKFASKSYCELLRKGAETVRSADRRSRIYFTEQEAGVPAAHRGQDYRDIAAALDVLAIEGGWQYGFKTDFKAKDEMEAVVATSRSRHFFNCDFYQALAKGVKPVVNDEHYCARFELGKRVPSHRSDYITSMWLEIMHGVSSSFVYVWDKRYWEANTPEKAYANVVNPSYKSSSLLNPYNVKPEDLCAFKLFQEELEPYKDKVLPFPRTKPATVAVYYSKATEIQRDTLPEQKVRPSVSDWYATILHANFPCKVVFDDGIAALGPEVAALVVPLAQCNPPSAAAAARAFQARGGLVIADEVAFKYDEYRKPVPVETSFARAKDPSEAVAKLLAAGVKRYAVLEPADGKGPIAASDAQVIDRGDFKLVCCAAMQEREPRRAKLRLSNLTPASGALYVRDVAQKRLVENGGRKTWTAAELAEGVPLELPPQERVVLVLTTGQSGRD